MDKGRDSFRRLHPRDYLSTGSPVWEVDHWTVKYCKEVAQTGIFVTGLPFEIKTIRPTAVSQWVFQEVKSAVTTTHASEQNQSKQPGTHNDVAYTLHRVVYLLA